MVVHRLCMAERAQIIHQRRGFEIHLSWGLGLNQHNNISKTALTQHMDTICSPTASVGSLKNSFFPFILTPPSRVLMEVKLAADLLKTGQLLVKMLSCHINMQTSLHRDTADEMIFNSTN